MRKFVPAELWRAYEQSLAQRAAFPQRSVSYSSYIHGSEAVAANRVAAQSRTAELARKQAWQKILRHLYSRLLAGELIAYAREAFPFGPARAIPAEAWRSLRIVGVRSGRVKGPGTDLIGIRIDDHPPQLIEGESTHSPDLVVTTTAAAPFFSANADYTSVQIGEYEFQFGPYQAAVVGQLHAASLRGDPWQHGKVLLYDVGASTKSIGDLFRRHTDPSWRLLIDFRHNGEYRLRPFSNTMPEGSEILEP